MNRPTALLLMLVLAACGSESPPAAGEAEDQDAEPEHFLSEQHRAMDRARAVQDQVNEAARRRLDEVDRQTRDDRDGDD